MVHEISLDGAKVELTDVSKPTCDQATSVGISHYYFVLLKYYSSIHVCLMHTFKAFVVIHGMYMYM